MKLNMNILRRIKSKKANFLYFGYMVFELAVFRDHIRILFGELIMIVLEKFVLEIL